MYRQNYLLVLCILICHLRLSNYYGTRYLSEKEGHRLYPRSLQPNQIEQTKDYRVNKAEDEVTFSGSQNKTVAVRKRVQDFCFQSSEHLTCFLNSSSICFQISAGDYNLYSDLVYVSRILLICKYAAMCICLVSLAAVQSKL